MIRLARGSFCLALALAGVAHADVPPNPTSQPAPQAPNPTAPGTPESTGQEPEEKQDRFSTIVAIVAVIVVYGAMRMRSKQVSSDPTSTGGA